MLIEESNDPPLLKTYRIHYRSGVIDYVQASGYSYDPQNDQLVFNVDNNPVATLPQASGVRSVIDTSYLPEAPLIVELVERIEALEETIKGLLEKSSGLALAFSSGFLFL